MRVAIWQCFALVARLTSHSSVFRAFAAILYYLPQPVQLWANRSDTGVSPAEIKLGQIVPLSGPISVAGVVGYASRAYFAHECGGAEISQPQEGASTVHHHGREPLQGSQGVSLDHGVHAGLRGGEGRVCLSVDGGP